MLLSRAEKHELCHEVALNIQAGHRQLNSALCKEVVTHSEPVACDVMLGASVGKNPLGGHGD